MPLRTKTKPRGKGRPFLPGAANPRFGLRYANRNANVLCIPVAGQIERIELTEPMDMALSVESKSVASSLGEHLELPNGYLSDELLGALLKKYGPKLLRHLMLEKYGPNDLRILLLPDDPDESGAEIIGSKYIETSCPQGCGTNT